MLFRHVRNKLFVLILILITFFSYSLSLNNQFLWDDETQIVGNNIIHNLKNLPLLFTGGIVYTPATTLSGGFYRPILTLTYMILYTISSGPFIFRLFQITTHITNTLLVYLIFEILFLKHLNRNGAAKSAFAGALIFAVHPAISEAVLFIAGLGEPLFTLFCLISFLCLLKQDTPLNRLLSAVFFLLALLTKETAVILLFIFFIYMLLFTSIKKSYQRLINPATVLLGYVILRLTLIKGGLSGLKFPAPIAQTPFLGRLVNIPYEIGHYLTLIILPYRLSISQHHVVTSITDIRFWGSTAIIIFLTFGIIIFYRQTKNKLFIFFILWFLLGFLPVLNIFPLSSTIAERWLYFPFIGFVGSLLILVTHVYQKIKLNKHILTAVFIIIIALLSLKTISRTLNWRNGLTLYAADLKNNPTSFELLNNYGVELFRIGKTDEAGEYFKKSIAVNGQWWTHYNNLGVVFEREGNFEKAKEYYQKSIDTGNYYLAYENLGQIYVKNKDFQTANEFFAKAIPFFPLSESIHRLYAISLYQSGTPLEAVKEIKTALQLEPSAQNYLLFQKMTNKEKLTLEK